MKKKSNPISVKLLFILLVLLATKLVAAEKSMFCPFWSCNRLAVVPVSRLYCSADCAPVCCHMKTPSASSTADSFGIIQKSNKNLAGKRTAKKKSRRVRQDSLQLVLVNGSVLLLVTKNRNKNYNRICLRNITVQAVTKDRTKRRFNSLHPSLTP